jgi:hypothetical protein
MLPNLSALLLIMSLLADLAAAQNQAIPKALPADPEAPSAVDPLPGVKLDKLENWVSEISFRPSTAVQGIVFGQPTIAPSNPWHFHKLERGTGPLVLEYQELQIQRMPVILGQSMTVTELFNYLRNNMGEFMDPALATAKPHSFQDKWRLLADKTSAGAILDVEQKAEKSALVVSQLTGDTMALSSIFVGQPGVEAHTVAGTRWLGTRAGPGSGVTIYTKAVLRAVAEPNAPAGDAALWKGFLIQLGTWVNGLGGKATAPIAKPPQEHDWDTVSTTMFFPSERWLDLDGKWEVRETRENKLKRFMIQIHEGMAGATLVERALDGKELKREVRITGAGPGAWALERAQDAEVLAFLGVKEKLAAEALATPLPPSSLIVTRKGDKLSAVWKGVVLQTNGQQKFSQAAFKSRSYELDQLK